MWIFKRYCLIHERGKFLVYHIAGPENVSTSNTLSIQIEKKLIQKDLLLLNHTKSDKPNTSLILRTIGYVPKIL